MTMTNEAQDYWNRHARNYDRSMAILGKPLPRMLALVTEAVRDLGSVLEVAAGSGLVTVAIAAAAREVVATDYAAAMVTVLESRVRQAKLTNVRCEPANIYDLPFVAGGFDAVVAANVLHLVPDLPGALEALRRQLTPGARLIVPTYCHDETAFSWLLSRALALTGFPGTRRFRLETLVRVLEHAGLQVTKRELIPGPIPIGYVEGTFSQPGGPQ
jgi:ubiquinone/menaquinone biosynthesis C-methylase UbiE